MSERARVYITVDSQDVRQFLAQGFEVDGVRITMSRPIHDDDDAKHVAGHLRIVARDEGGKLQD